MDVAVTLLILVALVCSVILIWAGRKRFPLRIGFGNFFRRKTQVAIVVAGLLVGTAIISSSYAIQSTFDATIKSEVFRTLDYVDEEIYTLAPDGSFGLFNISVYTGLSANLSASNLPHVSAVAPRYQASFAVYDNRSQLFQPASMVIGFDADHELGSFTTSGGSSWTGSGLGPGEVILNQKMADDVEAKKGDLFIVYLVVAGRPFPLPMNVAEIVQNTGRGAWRGASDIFMRLDVLQTALGHQNMINLIVAANVGGPKNGYLDSDLAVNELRGSLPTALTVDPVKSDQIDQATQSMAQFGQLFTLLGTFTIIAGVLLIVNIFVMLAEERKGEMGVARALGMRRQNLVQSYVAEGLLYALFSAAVGTLVGLLLAAVIIWAFQAVFPASFFGVGGFVFTWTATDLAQAFTLGFLITMATILLASWRVSKLNIVRAIRDIPEPTRQESTRLQVGMGALLIILGVLGTIGAITASSALLQDVGPALIAIGLSVAVMRAISPRIAFSASGLFVIAWLLYPNKPIPLTNAGIDQFIIAGLLLVFAGLLVILFNSDTLLAVATRVARRRTWRPVIRTAVAYPMNKKFRTGITLASIALVMFTIATMAGIESMVSSTLETTTLRQSGGFDIIATSSSAITNWTSDFSAAPVHSNISEARAVSTSGFRFSKNQDMSGDHVQSVMYGMPADWADPPFDFQSLDPLYPTRQAAWGAIQTNESLGILDGSVAPQQFVSINARFGASVGDFLYYNDTANVTHRVKIIGILYEPIVTGLFVGWNTVKDDFGVNAPSLFYFKVASGQDSTAVSHDLERTFLAYGMFTFDLGPLIKQILQAVVGVFNLLEAYLALGLIVGIAGLGVITMRNVVDRRSETGALRALGFRRSMVLRSYLFELSFIALTGIVLGDILGIAISYDLYLKFFSAEGSFIIPWATVILLSGIAFVGALLATASPAIRASRMPPAVALRKFE